MDSHYDTCEPCEGYYTFRVFHTNVRSQRARLYTYNVPLSEVTQVFSKKRLREMSRCLIQLQSTPYARLQQETLKKLLQTKWRCYCVPTTTTKKCTK